MRIQEVVSAEPYAHVKTEDTFEHSLWKVPVEDSGFFCSEFDKLSATYVADGHHRAAAAFNVGKRRRERAAEAGREVTGEEPFNFFMTILYPADNLKILDYNRVIKSLNDLTTTEFVDKLSEYFTIDEIPADGDKAPSEQGVCSLLIDSKWHSCRIKPELIDTSSPAASLDCALLQKYCFEAILGIDDVKRDPRVEFVGGIRGLAELEYRCNKDCVAAFLMHPVQMDDVIKVADAGEIMPPKCTWYEPKPRSGFVVNVFPE